MSKEDRTFAKMIRGLAERVAALESKLRGAPMRPGRTGGGGFKVRIVQALPDPPAAGYQKVFWASPGGDNQCWSIFVDPDQTDVQDTWTPDQLLTTRSGIP